ncbi:hypothetical protein GCM10028796_19370 [Ramlibacter monticola]|uniref:EF-hand domain-containing protein n=1 Tax=Ramlibacter monticola TaxID=1926872 RepID=A0A936YZ81_9BURK|nr:hypothetical protein [Ramlibacter monticola]MBL0392195.1 hypothetical protein [Ramlibacter monticola]
MPAFSRLAAVLFACVAASAAQAQLQRAPAKVQAVPNPKPSAAARVAQTAPNPTGLMSRFPAGISSGSGAAVSTDPVAASTTPIPATGSSIASTTLIPTELPPAELLPTTPLPGTTIVTPGVTTPTTQAVATNVLGAGAGATVRGPGQAVGGAGGFSATDQARSWFFADANHDGDLTRAEFMRLSIATMSFEEMDRNYDGVVSRFEYEDSLR